MVPHTATSNMYLQNDILVAFSATRSLNIITNRCVWIKICGETSGNTVNSSAILSTSSRPVESTSLRKRTSLARIETRSRVIDPGTVSKCRRGRPSVMVGCMSSRCCCCCCCCCCIADLRLSSLISFSGSSNLVSHLPSVRRKWP